MTKLNGTSGQLFSVIAESMNARGTARSAKGSAGQASGDSSFHDLIHTVSKLAKNASSDQRSEGAVKAGSLRSRLAQLTEHDEPTDEPVREHTEADDKPASPQKSDPVDHATKLDVQNRLTLPAVVGQALAAVPVAKPQVQPSGGDKGAAAARTERPTVARALPGASAASAMKADVAESGTRPVTAAPEPTPRGNAVPQSMLQGDAAPPKTISATSGFEAVATNIEHAAKASVRQALPEATKVTVVQQETHLPPVSQISATQQIASAVVAELKGSSAAASSAAPDLAPPQSNVPDQPLKILTISLEPQALGNVTVRLRLVGATVSVHLAAERQDTSQMLDQQRDSIRELMQSAGYVAEVAPVRHGPLDGFHAGTGQSQPHLSGQQQQQQSPQSQGTFDGFNTSSGRPDGGAKQARQERQPNQETRHDHDVAPRDRRGPVYL